MSRSSAAATIICLIAVVACSPGNAATEPSATTPSATAVATVVPSIAPVPSATSSGSALPAFEPDEPLTLFGQLTGAGGGVFVMRPDETGMQQLATDILPGVHKRGDWSPDGQRVVLIDETTERMWIAHLDGTATERVPACDTPGCDYPSWSPDGKRIAFSRSESAPGVIGPKAVAIYVVDLATGHVSPVVRLERPLLSDAPRWSPDGTQIVFQVDRMDDASFETGASIAVVPVAGGKPRYLTDFDSFATSPDWGWVTNEIVYGMDLIGLKQTPGPDDDTWDLYAVRPDGSGARRITNVPKGQLLQSPRWTPDGTRLTAYDHLSGGGILVDPTTGTFEHFVTSGTFTRPLIRPLPSP